MAKTKLFVWEKLLGGDQSSLSAAAPQPTVAPPPPPPPASKRVRSAPDGAFRGDNCRTPAQKEQYPEGRTRLTQLIASTPLEGKILGWILSHPRSRRGTSDTRDTRHTALWRLLRAGWHTLFGDGPQAAAQSPLPQQPASEETLP